jgi:DNA-binding CsgD family transcriptional regulator
MKNVIASEVSVDRNFHLKLVPNHPLMSVDTQSEVDSKQSASLLSSRELTIVQCVAAGLSSSEIAERLFISPHTVRQHRKNILQKAEAKNVAHLVKIAYAKGWI